ncbi:hypothetical protein ACFPRL_15885 [Pseudoclavibacter helvolus]
MRDRELGPGAQEFGYRIPHPWLIPGAHTEEGRHVRRVPLHEVPADREVRVGAGQRVPGRVIEHGGGGDSGVGHVVLETVDVSPILTHTSVSLACRDRALRLVAPLWLHSRPQTPSCARSS